VRRAGTAVRIATGQRALDLRAASWALAFFSPTPSWGAEIVRSASSGAGGVEAALDSAAFLRRARAAVRLASRRARPAAAAGMDDPAAASDAHADRLPHRTSFTPLVILFKRVANILKAATETLPESLDRARLTEPAEQELLAALEAARGRTAPLWRERDYGKILPALLEMEHAIHGFFDRVLVNVDDLPTRANRLKRWRCARSVRPAAGSRVVVEGRRRLRADVPHCRLAASRARRASGNAPALAQPRAGGFAISRDKYADSLESVNDRCLVKKTKLSLAVRPVYVNWRPIGFGSEASVGLFLKNPEKYLKEQNIDMRCVVNQGRHAAPDPKRRVMINYEIFYLSTQDALAQLREILTAVK
jgi:hypothetical protein